MTYKKCTFVKTAITTETRRSVFGRVVVRNERLCEISGRISKPAGTRPFLTSYAECRRFVNLAEDAAKAADRDAAEAALPLDLQASDTYTTVYHERYRAYYESIEHSFFAASRRALGG